MGGWRSCYVAIFFSQINLVKEAIVSQYLYDFDTRKWGFSTWLATLENGPTPKEIILIISRNGGERIDVYKCKPWLWFSWQNNRSTRSADPSLL